MGRRGQVGRQTPLTLLAVMTSAMGLGCPSEPLADDQANDIVMACCGEARERVEIAKDVETQEFRERCGLCKRGTGKGKCESAAAKVQYTVRRAYGEDPMPVSCTTMRGALEGVGIAIPQLR